MEAHLNGASLMADGEKLSWNLKTCLKIITKNTWFNGIHLYFLNACN